MKSTSKEDSSCCSSSCGPSDYIRPSSPTSSFVVPLVIRHGAVVNRPPPLFVLPNDPASSSLSYQTPPLVHSTRLAAARAHDPCRPSPLPDSSCHGINTTGWHMSLATHYLIKRHGQQQHAGRVPAVFDRLFHWGHSGLLGGSDPSIKQPGLFIFFDAIQISPTKSNLCQI